MRAAWHKAKNYAPSFVNRNITYDPLPRGSHIRLLEVSVDPTSRELLCNFKVITLEPCTYSYQALSYAWEDPEPVSRLRFSDGNSLPISATLSKLFDSLRKRYHAFTIWIDALCINQKDDDERASQVALMGKVYSCAEQVLLWLGDSTADTSTAFRFMESKKSLAWPDDWDKEEDFSALNSMNSVLSRPWFQRVWVIQEVTLNDHILMMCGDELVDFANIRSCVFAVWRYGEKLNAYEDESPAFKGLWCATRLLYLRDEYQESKAVRYEILLQAAFHCQATDKRDMVFAFRGLADNSRPVPEPDYTVSIQYVCTQTAIALLCHGESLDLLALSGFSRRQEVSDLPTWVPDLRNHSYEEPFVLSDGAGWKAGGDLQMSPVFVAPNQLRLRGQLFDYVEVTCSPFDSTSVVTQKKAMQEILALQKRLPLEVSESAWLDIMAQTLTCGLDIEDEPIELDKDRGSFLECLEILQASSGETDVDKLNKNMYYRTMGPRVDGWKAFLTRRGYLCIGPPNTIASDMVYLAPGCNFPLLLTPDSQGDESEPLLECVLVSWCFVQGIMLGEGINKEEQMVDILLR